MGSGSGFESWRKAIGFGFEDKVKKNWVFERKISCLGLEKAKVLSLGKCFGPEERGIRFGFEKNQRFWIFERKILGFGFIKKAKVLSLREDLDWRKEGSGLGLERK